MCLQWTPSHLDVGRKWLCGRNPRMLTAEQKDPLSYEPKQTREQQDARPGIFPPEAADFETNVKSPCRQ